MMSTPPDDAEVIHLRPHRTDRSGRERAGRAGARPHPPHRSPRPRLRSAHASDLVAVERDQRSRVDAFVGRYLQALVEIASGDRPVTQVLRHTVPEVYDELAAVPARSAAAGGLTPGRARRPNPTRPVVIGVRTALIRGDALEVSAHVRYGRRSRAVAARFEVVRGRWQCVAIAGAQPPLRACSAGAVSRRPWRDRRPRRGRRGSA